MTGKGILIVEDELLISMSLEDVLSDAGYAVVGTACSVATAFDRLSTVSFGAALLDINLGRELVWPFAMALRSHRVAFAFLSSDCDREDFPREISDAPRMAKPFAEDELLAVVRSLLLARCA